LPALRQGLGDDQQHGDEATISRSERKPSKPLSEINPAMPRNVAADM
jgi:hypothetical protein